MRVTGLPGELKGSQAYPREFGIAIARVYRSHMDQLQREAAENARVFAARHPRYPMSGITDLLEDFGSDMWVDADLQEVFAISCRMAGV